MQLKVSNATKGLIFNATKGCLYHFRGEYGALARLYLDKHASKLWNGADFSTPLGLASINSSIVNYKFGMKKYQKIKFLENFHSVGCVIIVYEKSDGDYMVLMKISTVNDGAKVKLSQVGNEICLLQKLSSADVSVNAKYCCGGSSLYIVRDGSIFSINVLSKIFQDIKTVFTDNHTLNKEIGAAVVKGSNLYITGGKDENEMAVNSVFSFDCVKKELKSLAPMQFARKIVLP